MKTLLYFEEFESDLSHALMDRDDIRPIFIRTNKNLKFFTDDYLEKTKYLKPYVIDYYNDMDEEVEKFRDYLNRENIHLDYFLNDSEYYMEFSHRFAGKLGLEALSEEQLSWVRDKVPMKNKLREIGIDTALYREINSKDDIKNFFVKNDNKKIILKPRKGMNSKDLHIISSLEDIDNLDIDIKDNKYMAEEFLDDHEWHIESIIQNGKVLDSFVTYVPISPIWATIENDINCHVPVVRVPEYFKFSPRDLIQDIASGMDLKNGSMITEVFVSDDGDVKVGEIGFRLPGFQYVLNYSYSYGIDLNNIVIDIATHKDVNLNYRKNILSVGDLYLPNKEGIIKEITPLSDMLKVDGVIDGDMFCEVGDYQHKRKVGNDASGWIQAVGVNEKETLKILREVFNKFKIEVEDDKESKKVLKKYKS